MKIHLLAIDCQKDFCDPNLPGALYVPGAEQDMQRLSAMTDRLRNKIDEIHITLDSHNEIDIAHPIFWVNSEGNHPDPFTIISEEDVNKGVWTTTNPACLARATEYVQRLDENGRYPLCIWPTHCVVGTNGWTLDDTFAEAVSGWCKDRFKKPDYVTKGSNVFTEHYSAVKADVIDPSDPSTMLNTDLLSILSEADDIIIAGEALSHCVCETITDIADNFGEENIKKFVLLEDCSTSVPGFENLGVEFVDNMSKRGLRIEQSTNYLK